MIPLGVYSSSAETSQGPLDAVLWLDFSTGSSADAMGHTTTLVSGATISGGKLLVGGGSYLQVSDPNGDLNIAANQDFEFDFQFTANGGSGFPHVLGSAGSGSLSMDIDDLAGYGTLPRLYYNGLNHAVAIDTAVAANGQTVRYRLSRVNNILSVYKNGGASPVITIANFATNINFSNGGSFLIGASWEGNWITGSFDFVKLRKGAIYVP